MSLTLFVMINLLMNYYMNAYVELTWFSCWYMKCTRWWIIVCMLMLNYYMMYMSMEYYMKVCIYVDDCYMNNLLMNYYMSAYVEIIWWL